MNIPIDSFSLAFGDLAITEDRAIYGEAMVEIFHEFSGKPDYWMRWAGRERYLAKGGRRISDLPAEARKKYEGRLF